MPRLNLRKNSADGEGKFQKIDDLQTNLICNPKGLHFVDMNADGLDDCVCISPEGDLHVSLNEGNGSGDKLPTFKHIGLVKESEGVQALVRLADIDGDGRADYGVVDKETGAVSFWRNAWVEDKARWEALGVRATIEAPSKGSENFPEIRFEDVNGDVSSTIAARHVVFAFGGY
ncbi:VCBS repeat-containing protein [Candidatus Bathyarchaeota archaeon]|nr:VCBS repeat-containing protein [Candidatus Bathyarchaeota archaeon]